MQPNTNEWNRMITGKLYNPQDPYIQRLHKIGMNRCERFNKISLRRTKTKARALEKLIPSSQNNNLQVCAPFYCEYGVNISVGQNCFINYCCTFLDVAPIALGNEVFIGSNVTFATPSHPMAAEERLCANYPDGFHILEFGLPINIEDGCWICSSATICGGVAVGKNSVVAAGAVVIKDVPPNSLVAGVPAKVIRTIDDEDRINVWDAYINNRPLVP